MKNREAEEAVLLGVWKALGDPTRRQLMDLLRERPMTTGELATHFSTSRFAVMKHLEILAEAHLIFAVKQGRQRWNHLNPIPLIQVVDRWLQPFEQSSAQALLGIKRVTEELAVVPTVEGENKVSATATSVTAYDIRLEVRIRASKERVWKALVEETGQWWPKHFYTSERTRTFVVEAKVGGRVFEDWGGGNGGQWATVVVCQPEEKMTWSGDMFPDFGGTGRFLASYTLVDEGDGTLVKFHDSGFGALKGDASSSLESGWLELIETHLKTYIENGERGTH